MAIAYRALARRRCVAPSLAVVALVAPMLATPAFALDAAIARGLRELDLGARLEQRCDLEAMDRIARDKKDFRPDRVVASATTDARADGDELRGEGAAVRSRGKWYRLSYVCKTSDDHMDVVDFDYKIGESIPKAQWESLGLWE